MTAAIRPRLNAFAESTKRCAREAFGTRPLDLRSSAAHKQAGQALFVNGMSTRKPPVNGQVLEVAP